MDVRSEKIHSGGDIPDRYSAYAEGVSPPLRWSAVDGAHSYAIVVEDPDAPSDTPFVHWLAWNIPATITSIPEGLPAQARLRDLDGAVQGRSGRGSLGWFGPRPPEGDPPHHYHFKVLALDTELDVPAGAERDQVLQAAEGHVLDEGELVATYQKE